MSTIKNPRPYRVDVVKPGTKRISYRFATKGGRAANFLRSRHPIRLVTSEVEADLVDGGTMTTYGVTLLELGLVAALAPVAGPDFIAVHSAEGEEEGCTLTAEPPAAVEQPSLFTEPTDDGEEKV